MRFLNSLVGYSLKYPITIIMLSFGFFLFGLISAKNIKIDAIPDVTNTQVQVVTSAPSLSALEIEEYISYPVERGLAGIPQLEEIRSISRYGISLIILVFEEGTKIHLARQWVSERLNDLNNVISKDYGTIEMAPLTTALGEVLQFTLESEIHDNKELTSTILWYIIPQLKTVSGIVGVNLFGGEVEEFEIRLDLNRMKSFGITIPELISAIRSNNVLEGGGYVEQNKEHSLISVQSRIRNIEDIKKISINKVNSQIPIYLENFSTITRGHTLRKGAATSNGEKEVVGGIALMSMGDNALQVSISVEEKLNSIQNTLPEGMKIKIFYNRSKMIQDTIRTVIFNLTEGAILVILILFIMMGDVRSGLVIAIIIPLCMLFAISIMVLRDAPANLMSMGAVDFGLLVDGAVIVVENAHRRLGIRRMELGRRLLPEEKRKVIYESTLEVRKATVYGEMILGIVYLPILMLSGTAGILFKPMAWTVLYALVGAFIFTLTLIPVLCYYFLGDSNNEANQDETKILKYLKNKYRTILDKAFSKQKTILVVTALLFIATSTSFLFIGREFIPVLDEGSSLLEITRLPSASLSESVDSSLRLERALLNGDFPEIESVVSKTGSPNLALEPMGIEKTDVFIQLHPRKEWNRTKEELLQEILIVAERILPEAVFGMSQPIEMRINEMVAGIRSDVGIKIFGSDLNTLKAEGEKIKDQISKIKGVTDIRIEQLGGVTYLQIIPNRDNMARLGFQSREIANIVQMVGSGLQVDRVIDGAKRFDIRLKMINPPNHLTHNWESLLIPNSTGKYFPLKELASIEMKSGPAQVSHEWQERRLLLEFNVRGRDTLGVVEEVERLLDTKNFLPSGYRWEIDGSFQDYRKATKGLGLVVPLAFIGILFILIRAVGNLTVASLLFINMPFALIGGILALWIRGLPFSISAAVGFIALCGIAVLNSLVLVTFSLHKEENGMNPGTAIYESAMERFRPVIMTGIVAILGFIPMAVSTSPGSEVQRPLATVVIGGLITDSILTLFVFPVFYSFLRSKRNGSFLDSKV